MNNNIVLKFYTNENKYILENLLEDRNISTHSFKSLTSLRNYVRTETGLKRQQLSELIDMLMKNSVIFSNNPLIQTYVFKQQGGMNQTSSYPQVPAPSVPSVPSLPHTSSSNLQVIKLQPTEQPTQPIEAPTQATEAPTQHIQVQKEDLETTLNLDTVDLEDKEDIEPAYVTALKKKLEDLEDRYDYLEASNKKLYDTQSELKKQNALLELKQKQLLADQQRSEEKALAIHNSLVKHESNLYKQNEAFLSQMKNIKDCNILWSLIVIPYRSFETEAEEERFYRKTCRYFEKLKKTDNLLENYNKYCNNSKLLEGKIDRLKNKNFNTSRKILRLDPKLIEQEKTESNISLYDMLENQKLEKAHSLKPGIFKNKYT